MSSSELLRVVILAAGAGRRLGRDKAALPWGKTTLIGHILSRFPPNRVKQTVVVANPINADACRKIVPAGVQIAVNPEPGAEMLSSVRVGIAALSNCQGPLCVHPVDIFAITPDLIAMLHDAWLAKPDMIHLPTVGERGGHPLILPPRLIGEIQSIPDGNGLNYLVHEHADSIERHPWDDSRLLVDIDSPADYAHYAPSA